MMMMMRVGCAFWAVHLRCARFFPLRRPIEHSRRHTGARELPPNPLLPPSLTTTTPQAHTLLKLTAAASCAGTPP
jgi:hypothetical protein